MLHTAPSVTFAPSALPTWTFRYTYRGTPYHDLFVGTDPSTGGTTTVPTEVIPVKLTYGTMVTDPLAPLADGRNVVQHTTASPIFRSSVDFTAAGVDLGTTQYIDAYQRASLWGTVQANGAYHVLLGQPTVEPEQSFTVPPGKGAIGKPLGTRVLEADLNWFDTKMQGLLTSLHLSGGSLPIFVVTQTYLLSKGCCVGGYHNDTGTQAYSAFSYIQQSGDFAEDVSALSHEVGEYVNDPLTTNTDVPASCGPKGSSGHIYEVGDPLEGEAHYGTVPYRSGGSTYHLQDLVTPVYFGAPASTSVAGRRTFQGTSLAVCQNGG